MTKSNFHTHTLYCDGSDTPEELVQYAISLRCPAIGFSGHSHTGIPDDAPFCMSIEGTCEYKKELRCLKEKYKGIIDIFSGVEQDFYSDEPTDDYDYVIGSVHYILKDGVYLPVDESEELQVSAVNKFYNGDFYAYIEDYYALVGEIYNKTRCDIVGHFDLVTKFNEGDCLFDTRNPRYIKASDEALEKLLKENVKFEVNYGAIARGLRSLPYPEERLIEKIKKAGRETIKTSDCHKKENLLFGLL